MISGRFVGGGGRAFEEFSGISVKGIWISIVAAASALVQVEEFDSTSSGRVNPIWPRTFK